MVIHAPQEEEVGSLTAMAEKLKDPGMTIAAGVENNCWGED